MSLARLAYVIISWVVLVTSEEVIIALAMYPPNVIARSPFLLSLRATGYTGKVALATTSHLSHDDIATLSRLKINYYTLAVAQEPGRCQQGCLDTPVGLLEFNVGRLYFYRAALAEMNISLDAHVLLTDFRDVYFQDHPFAKDHFMKPSFGSNELMVFQETSYVIHDRYKNYNGGWIKDCFGADAVRRMEGYPVSCAGTVMGTARGVKHYLDTVIHALEDKIINAEEGTREACKATGADQAAHNFSIYTGLLASDHGFSLMPNGFGAVNTVGGACSPGTDAKGKPNFFRPLLLNERKQVLNQDGSLSPIVHQFDRCPEVEALVYGEWLDKWEAHLQSTVEYSSLRMEL